MEKIFYNGDIITVDENNPTATAVYIKDDRIVAVGSDDEVLAQKTADTELIDLAGKTMTPGFIDGHSHFSMAAKFGAFVDLTSPPIGDITCIDDVINRLSEALKTHDTTKPLIGVGFDHNDLKEKRFVTKFDLDKVSDTVPIIVAHAGAHTGAFNSAFLKELGVDENTKDPQGGVYDRVEGSTEPTGYVEENAFMPSLMKYVDQKEEAALDKAIEAGNYLYASNGVTTAQDGFMLDNEYHFYDYVTNKNDLLAIDVYGYVGALVENGIKDGKYPLKLHENMGKLKWAGMKIFLDGSPQARTAWMTKPYEVVDKAKDDPNYTSYPIYTDEQLLEGMLWCIEHDTQFLTHANGDAAADQYIKVWKQAISMKAPKSDLRPVVVHCQTTRADQIEEFGKLGVIPTFFTCHTYYWGDTHLLNLGQERGNKIANMKAAVDAGMVYTNHEDSPVRPPMILFSMWTAVNRITKEGVEIGKELRVSPMDALKAVTINGAYVYFEEDNIGSIEVGKLADLVIMDKNLLKVDPMEIKDIKVLETIKRGKTIFTAK